MKDAWIALVSELTDYIVEDEEKARKSSYRISLDK